MFKKICIELNAANPQIPFEACCPYSGSAASFTILNVPRPLGKRTVSAVYVELTNVAGVTRSFAAERVGSAWGATVPASAVGDSGVVTGGVCVWASGTDDAGATVDCWILGTGDLRVLSRDGTIAPGVVSHNVHGYAAKPDNPHDFDLAPASDAEGAPLELYLNGAWRQLGGGSTAPHASTHAVGGTDPVTIAQSQVTGLDSALAAKRDKFDEGCYNATFSRWAWSSDDAPRELVEAANAPGAAQPHFVMDGSVDGHWIFDFSILGYGFNSVGECIGSETQIETNASNDGSTYYHMMLTRTASADPENEYRLARREARAASALAKFDADGNLVADNSGKGLSTHDYTNADKAEVAKVKDKADEFTQWDLSGLLEFGIYDGVIEFHKSGLPDLGDWELTYTKDGVRHSAWKEFYYPYATVLTGFTDEYGEPTLEGFVATRKRVLRTGEALTPGLDDDGVPTDPNVQELFSKSDTSTAANPDLNNKVLQASVNVIVAAKTATVATSATAPTSVTLADNDCKTVTMGTATALQIDFGAAKQTGALRLCELVIADAPSTALTLSFPSGHSFHSSMASGKWYTTETGRNHFFFEETATNVWTVTRQVETSDTPTTTHAEGCAE